MQRLEKLHQCLQNSTQIDAHWLSLGCCEVFFPATLPSPYVSHPTPLLLQLVLDSGLHCRAEHLKFKWQAFRRGKLCKPQHHATTRHYSFSLWRLWIVFTETPKKTRSSNLQTRKAFYLPAVHTLLMSLYIHCPRAVPTLSKWMGLDEGSRPYSCK